MHAGPAYGCRRKQDAGNDHDCKHHRLKSERNRIHDIEFIVSAKDDLLNEIISQNGTYQHTNQRGAGSEHQIFHEDFFIEKAQRFLCTDQCSLLANDTT